MYDGRLYAGGTPNFSEQTGTYTSPPQQQAPVQSNPMPQFATVGQDTPVQSPPIMAPPSAGGPSVGPPSYAGGNPAFQEFHGAPSIASWSGQMPQMSQAQQQHHQMPSISQFQMPAQYNHQHQQPMQFPMQPHQVPSIGTFQMPVQQPRPQAWQTQPIARFRPG